MSLPLTHAGLSAPGISAALDLKFASTLSLTSSSGITPSFSRASTGSYFDSAGVLRYANVNLLNYSEQFNDASWAKSAASISANSIVAPDGKTTADSLFEASGVNYHGIFPASGISTSTTQNYTLSAYVKKGNRRYFAIGFSYSNGLGSIVQFDLDTAASAYSFANGGYGVVSSSAADVGNGWIRISAVLTTTSTTSYPTFINTDALFTTGNIHQNAYSGDPTKFTYIWGAQLEASSTVGTYVPTTNAANSAPRFDHTYNGTSWVSRGLLVEEQRTNGTTYSEQFNNALWTQYQASVTADSIASPDGNQTADSIVENSSNSEHFIYKGGGGASVTAGLKYSMSVYAKKGSRDFVALASGSSSPFGSGAIAYFNLNTGTVGTLGAAVNSATITPVGNGWYRCSAILTAVSSTTAYEAVGSANVDGSFIYQGNGSTSSYIWGFQLEAGSFPTSYIPTTNSSSVRSADVCQITGSDFTSFWNASEGSFAVDADVIGNQSSNGNQVAVNIGNGTSSNRIDIIRNINNLGGDVGAYVKSSNIEQVFLSTASGVWNVNNSYKASFGFKANDFAFSSNGSAVITDASGSVPTANQMAIGNYSFVNSNLNGHIARLRYFNKRLPNATLQKLST